MASDTETSIADGAKIAAIAASAGIMEIDILGGEPTLLPALTGIVDAFVDRGIRLYLSSNGSNVAVLEQLSKRYLPPELQIGISVGSDSPPSNLSRYISHWRPVLKSVCRKGATPPLWLTDLLRLTGVHYCHIFMDALRPEDLAETLSFPEYLNALASLQQLWPNVDGVACGGFIPDPAGLPTLRTVRCPAGTTKLSVMPDGSVYPCYLLFRSPAFRLGNILRDPFDQIWGHPVLALFRYYQGNRCPRLDCPVLSSCHGGCPALALISFGRIDGPDPRCVRPGSY